ncbi:hypothetical protein PENTCL1PPCAC_17239, partial [Pristionchus entomophagus]
VLFSALLPMATSQCAAADHASCTNWVRNGFCANAAYNKAVVQQYCPMACTNSGCVTTTSTTENTNCNKWANDASTVFCAAPNMPKAQKSFFCPTTCAGEIAEAEDCAVYVQNGAQVKKTTAKTDVNTAVKTGASTTNKILNIYVKATCKLSFYASATPVLGNDNHVKDYTGTTAQSFFRLSVQTEKESGSFVCNCNP